MCLIDLLGSPIGLRGDDWSDALERQIFQYSTCDWVLHADEWHFAVCLLAVSRVLCVWCIWLQCIVICTVVRLVRCVACWAASEQRCSDSLLESFSLSCSLGDGRANLLLKICSKVVWIGLYWYALYVAIYHKSNASQWPWRAPMKLYFVWLAPRFVNTCFVGSRLAKLGFVLFDCALPVAILVMMS